MSTTPLPCWPDWMPKPQRSGYQYEPVDRTIRTEMEIGGIYRVEFNTDETVIQCSLILCNRLQLEFFEAFERGCLRRGTRWFQMPIWINGKTEWYKCRFRARPKFAVNSTVTHTTVTMQLEIEERDLLDTSLVDLLINFGPDGVAALVKAIRDNLRIRPGVTVIPPDVWAFIKNY